MILKDGMLLYHGSYTEVERVLLEKCAKGKDFGRGFYLTSDLNQARSFVNTSVKKAQRLGQIPLNQNHGFVSSFRYHNSEGEMKIHVFNEADRDWLWFISQNRRTKLATILKEKTDTSIFESDIIIGKIANDTTNPVITTYLNGLYGDILSEEAVEFAIKQLMPDHLIDQYCFLTQKAIDCLTFQEARRYAL